MERTWKPTVAGVLDIIAGAYGVTGGIVLLTLSSVFTSGITGMGGEGAEIGRFFATGFCHVLGWVHIAFGLLAIPGGILNLQRRGWPWAIVFSVAAIVASFVLGLIALILTAMSEKEFRPAGEPARG